VPLAPSFDTPGWLARSGSIATAVGEVLLSSFTAGAGAPSTLIVLDDVVARARSSVLPAGIDALAARLGARLEHALLGAGDDLDRWRDAYRVLQGAEAWAVHGPWIRADDPPMGAAVRARFEAASRLTTDEIAAAMGEREQVTARLGTLVGDGTALLVPAAGGPPLRADSDPATIDAFRHATMTITVLAPLAGLPAVALPIATDGLPMGLSLIGAAGDDESLLASLVP
ncbi:MAG: amidase, partial [Thermoanaerobaculia bacterium]|nr:amidase [Thermoanaerobaculia bacterium]